MNAFLELAERQISNPRKARLRATESRQKRAQQDRDLLRDWRNWRHERIEALLAGPCGEAARALFSFLDKMALDHAPALLELVEGGPWRNTDSDTRFEVLALIDTAIIRLRERHGLVPFDDALPDEPPNAFLVIREALR